MLCREENGGRRRHWTRASPPPATLRQNKKAGRGFQPALGSSRRLLRGERGPGGLDSWRSSSQMGQGFLGPGGGMRPWREPCRVEGLLS